MTRITVTADMANRLTQGHEMVDNHNEAYGRILKGEKAGRGMIKYAGKRFIYLQEEAMIALNFALNEEKPAGAVYQK